MGEKFRSETLAPVLLPLIVDKLPRGVVEKWELEIARDEKTDLPNVKGEVKRAIKATFAHLCTTLTRDKCLPLLAVKGESSGDKGRFCHAFNPYL